MFIIKDLNGGHGLGYVREWPVKGRPVYTPYRDQAARFDSRAAASKWLNYRTYYCGFDRGQAFGEWPDMTSNAECNLRLAVVEKDS